MLNTISRQKILAMVLYVASTLLMVFLFQRQMHQIARFANIDFAQSQVLGASAGAGGAFGAGAGVGTGDQQQQQGLWSFPTKKFETVPAHFGLSQEQVGGHPSEPVRVFHVSSSLCSTRTASSSTADYDDANADTDAKNVKIDLELPNPSDKKIAILAKRGDCSFEEKARNVVSWFQKNNDQVKYLIIYDDSNDDENEKDTPKIRMGATEFESSNVPLMLLFVSQDTAHAIIQASIEAAVQSEGNVSSVMITIDSGSYGFGKHFPLLGNTFTDSFDNKMKLFAIQVIASIFVTILSFIFTASVLLYCYRDTITVEISRNGIMFSQLDGAEEQVDPKKLFSEEQVMELPVLEYGTRDADIETQSLTTTTCSTTPTKKCKASYCNSTCSICLEDYELKEELRVLPCGHLFHTECIVPWLTTRAANCPLCKEEFVIAPQKTGGAFSRFHGLLGSDCSPLRCRRRTMRRTDVSGSDDESETATSSSDSESESSIRSSYPQGDVEVGTPRRRAVQATSSSSN